MIKFTNIQKEKKKQFREKNIRIYYLLKIVKYMRIFT